MGRLKLAIAVKDHATQTWTSYKGGKSNTETFVLKRQPPQVKSETKPDAACDVKPTAQAASPRSG